MHTPPRPLFAPLDERQREGYALLTAIAAQMVHEPRPAPASHWLSRLTRRLRTRRPPVRGAYLWGGVGRGKTFLMDTFFDEVKLVAKQRMHFHHFMQEMHDRLAGLPPQPDPLEVLADGLADRVRLLCLDEFTVTDITDAMILHGLLRACFARGITLVTTSNTPPDELYANGLQRERFLPAIELLRQNTSVFNLDGGIDYRLRTLKQADVYFSPLNAAADAGMTRLFEDLAAGHEEAVSGLLINHRNIPVRRLGRGVAWFDFAGLCEGPRGTADYIEIAREYHTVLLSGVPVLTPARDAAARRFLHLVDEFYDRNVKLIVSAATPLKRIYEGDALVFEYQRLRSRLTEMQSVDYLARPHLPL